MSSELVPASVNLPAHPDNLISDSTRDRIARSVPENTRAAYERQWNTFTSWCSTTGRTPLPATAETLAEYVGHLADLDRAPSTIEQGIAAVRTAHRHAGHPGLPDTAGALAVLKAHRHERAEAGKRKRKAPPVTLAPLRAMIDATDPTKLAGLRDRALLVLGFAMMARRSELAALHIPDLAFTDDGLTVLIRKSKTDKEAVGAEVTIPRGSHPDTDPVRVVQAWLAALAKDGVTDGVLLRRINRWDQLQDGGMSGAAVNERVRHLAEKAGVPDAGKFTAHGLRAGGPTEAAKAGTPVAFIAEHGRWSPMSPQVHEYVRAVDRWRDNPMRGIGL
ncbi:site-specific integrase [Kitasatospora sp. A2-31]|uniref:site-specific integrase n=1 Tax=Kitasatospora sp. A2-31 TaxID=2916414 RepID=UPI001EEB68BB|nr:site-specific integrase [Kitasatospora sp. A2-31]MCG6497634.1 site-specific integrase [Kitasatospora sp. A2-31]